MSTTPIAPLEELTVVPLAEVETQALIEFADELASVPRYFGNGAIPRPSSRWRSVLVHPSVVRGVAALVDGDLVGAGRLVSRPAGGVDLYLAVAAPWRRQGIGSHLVRTVVATAALQGVAPLVAIAEHRKAPVRALAERFSMTVIGDGPHGLEFRTPLAA